MKKLPILLLLIAVITGQAYSQMTSHWKVVGHFPNSVCPYFFNEKFGFAYSNAEGAKGDIVGNPFLYRTTDGGDSWEQVGKGLHGWNIRDMFFTSSSHGYVATSVGRANPGPLSGGIFETTDGGISWVEISPPHYSFDAVTSMNGVVYAGPIWENSDPSDSYNFGFSKDSGRSWQFSGIDIPLPPFACSNLSNNLESNLIGAVNYGNSGTHPLYTTDAGNTWHLAAGVNCGGWGSCAIPHTKEFFIANEENTSNGDWGGASVYRSTDGGATWTDLEAKNLGGMITGGITASGCGVVYVQRWRMSADSGLVRSTDHGTTWSSVGGPTGHIDNKSICTAGTGAVIFAMDLDGNIWRSTDGGDGALSASITPDLHVAVLRQGFTGTSGRDTLITTACDSTTFSLAGYFAGCLRVAFDSVALEGIGDNTYRSTLHAGRWLDQGSDTVMVTLHGITAGTYPVTLHARFLREDEQSVDSVFRFTLLVRSNPGTLSVAGLAPHDLGTQALCAPERVVDSFSVAALGCEAVSIDSIVFRPDNGQSKDFTFTNVTKSFLIGAQDAAKTYRISFLPQSVGQQSGSVIVFSSAGNDTIRFRGGGVSDSRTFSVTSPPVALPRCESREVTVTVYNPTCGTLTIDSAALPSGVTLPMDTNGQPQLPLGLGKGATHTFTLLVSASSTDAIGTVVKSLTLHNTLAEISGTTHFDTVMSVPVTVSHGTAALALSGSTLDLGPASTCLGTTGTFTVTSTGCDSLTITQVELTGDNAFTLTSSTTDTTMATGGSRQVTVTFAPQSPGSYSARVRLHVQGLDPADPGHDTTIELVGTGVAGTKTLAVSLPKLDFGQTTVCEEREDTLTLKNKGCSALTITDLETLSKYFGAEAVNVKLPVTIAPGDSMKISVVTHADTAGHPTVFSGTLHIISDAENTVPDVTLTRGIVYPVKLRIEVVDASASGTAGAMVTFRLHLLGELPSAIKALHFDLTHDDDLLAYRSLTGAGLQLAGTSGATTSQKQSFTLAPVRDTGIIGELTFRSYLAKASTTPLSLSAPRFDAPGFTMKPECLAVIDDSGSSFTYLYQCGEHLLQSAMQGAGILIESISPNPASRVLEVKLGERVTELSLTDLLGRTVLEVKLQQPTAQLDLSAVPSGVYYLRAKVEGRVQSRRVVIER